MKHRIVNALGTNYTLFTENTAAFTTHDIENLHTTERKRSQYPIKIVLFDKLRTSTVVEAAKFRLENLEPPTSQQKADEKVTVRKSTTEYIQRRYLTMTSLFSHRTTQ